MQNLDNIKTYMVNLTIYHIISENYQLESKQKSRVKCDIN